MKKLIALFAVASVATAFAAEDNVFGCLRVDSSAPETIVSIPWIGAGVNGEAIKVADIVKTTNLNDGDELWWYDGSQGVYFTWRLVEGAWVEQQTVIGNETKTPTGANKQALARGNSILLMRTSPIADCFYLYGQAPASADIGTMELGVGTDKAPCYTLIAPPSVEDTDINLAVWTNVAANDYIIVVDKNGKQHQLFYNSSASKWGELSYDASFNPQYDSANAKILAGQGAWFVSAKGVGKTLATVDWTPKTEE